MINTTRLTCLIHTLLLPSNWNLDKNFALTGESGQVHMTKKYFRCEKMVIFVTEVEVLSKMN